MIRFLLLLEKLDSNVLKCLETMVFGLARLFLICRYVYDDGDERNLSLNQIRALQSNMKLFNNTVFNDNLSCRYIGSNFRIY